ncbi:MAG: phosphoribosylanthranilate isomerase [Bacteroidota bacterium]
MLIPKVKICCIANMAEAMLAINAGAAAVGLVGQMPSGPGVISDEKIAQIARNIPTSIDSFLLTSETSAKGIIEHHQKVQTTTIQMVDELVEGTYAQIRRALPKVKLVQVIHVIDEQSVEQAAMVAREVDMLLLDSGNPYLAVKELGGTGRTHNWKISQAIVQRVAIPVFLAGGLKTENVSRAIKQVQPYGLDLCSSVRTNGQLDGQKLAAFFQAVRRQEEKGA